MKELKVPRESRRASRECLEDLGMNYYVNFLGRLSSKGFHVRFGTYGN